MKIENIKVSDLSEFDGNCKIHDPKQIDNIIKSIKDFGFNVPIVIDENNTILCGHGRVEACKKAKIKEVPCVRLTHLSDIEKKEFVIKDNSLNLSTGFEEDELMAQLKSLEDFNVNFDLDSFGLDDFDFGLDDLTPPVLDEPKEKKEKLCPHCGCPL